MVTDAPLLTPETCSQRQCDVARTLACPERAAHGGVSNGPSSALAEVRCPTSARLFADVGLCSASVEAWAFRPTYKQHLLPGFSRGWIKPRTHVSGHGFSRAE